MAFEDEKEPDSDHITSRSLSFYVVENLANETYPIQTLPINLMFCSSPYFAT